MHIFGGGPTPRWVAGIFLVCTFLGLEPFTLVFGFKCRGQASIYIYSCHDQEWSNNMMKQKQKGDGAGCLTQLACFGTYTLPRVDTPGQRDICSRRYLEAAQGRARGIVWLDFLTANTDGGAVALLRSRMQRTRQLVALN